MNSEDVEELDYSEDDLIDLDDECDLEKVEQAAKCSPVEHEESHAEEEEKKEIKKEENERNEKKEEKDGKEKKEEKDGKEKKDEKKEKRTDSKNGNVSTKTRHERSSRSPSSRKERSSPSRRDKDRHHRRENERSGRPSPGSKDIPSLLTMRIRAPESPRDRCKFSGSSSTYSSASSTASDYGLIGPCCSCSAASRASPNGFVFRQSRPFPLPPPPPHQHIMPLMALALNPELLAHHHHRRDHRDDERPEHRDRERNRDAERRRDAPRARTPPKRILRVDDERRDVRSRDAGDFFKRDRIRENIDFSRKRVDDFMKRRTYERRRSPIGRRPERAATYKNGIRE
ncbi:unnamed protein product [Caenorhabditis bovis]|nr:unnamed protein product [Caenorhabditis bovis]